MSENEILLTHILKCSPLDLILNKPVLNPQQHQQFIHYQERRRNGEPLQYILGSWSFMGLDLKVTPAVLVPRPETEQLVELVLVTMKSKIAPMVLDIGTGSGNIPIALAHFHPTAQITSIDISPEALAIAQINAKAHGLTHRIKFLQGDVKELVDVTNSFDFIISNPPYIAAGDLAKLPQDVQCEPRLALEGGEDGLDFYRAIIKLTPSLLRPEGYLMMEFGDGQAEEIEALVQKSHFFLPTYIVQDLTQRDRFIVAQMAK